jgi:hypothetical protein
LSNSQKIIGFGFDPIESEHHYAVYFKAGNKEVVIFELTEYNEKLNYDVLAYKITSVASPARCILPILKWDRIKDDLRAEFNKRLKSLKLPSGQWKQGFNLLHRTLGKELLVLAWAIEDADPGTINLAIQNWLGLKPEERWWLFTITNAATGHAITGKGKGWRQALRFALTENPVILERFNFNYSKDSELPSLFEKNEELKKFGSKQ